MEGNRNPQGGVAEAEERVAAGRMKSPEAVTEQTAGYEPADTFRTKVFIANLATEARRNCNCFRAGHDSVKSTMSAAAVARWKGLERPLNHARGQVG
ncbi:MAG TPA: hypothetical protein VMU57_13875 [Edaphobacter sp.]|nr:hypothetical protein [Edaphobacter sp.]